MSLRAPRSLIGGALLLAVTLVASCGDDGDRGTDTDGPGAGMGRCADYDPQRNLYFGDLHVHTAFSFDAHAFGIRTLPDDAYRFARGESVLLPPLDADGVGTQRLALDRPLDFAAVTDHYV